MSEKIKIIVAEDDFLIAEETVRIVKHLGYQVVGVASNGIKAVDLALKLKPDVILMDIKMPKMDGLEAAKKIYDQNDEIAIVILSAHESTDLIDKAGSFGVSAYLTKPPKADEIHRAINIALARHNDLIKTKNLVRQLEEHKQKLHEINATKDKFFSIIAHDLRNPVSSLYSFTDYLSQHSDKITSDNMQQYIKAIHNTSKSLFDLLDELLLWGRLQSDRCPCEPQPVKIQDIVRSIVDLLHATALNKHINIVNLVDNESMAYADKNMIQTVLRNIISNALKFTPENGEITIKNKIENDLLEITVTDTGIGLRDEDISRLFRIDDQFTTPGTNGEKGTGLGLILCKEMIERNNGKIWVESKIDVGSSFIFALPMPVSVLA
jgi:two-component system, sensor histidine kinase and response regulator